MHIHFVFGFTILLFENCFFAFELASQGERRKKSTRERESEDASKKWEKFQTTNKGVYQKTHIKKGISNDAHE